MTDLARMRFQSAKNPDEGGWLAIDTFGNLRVEPNDEMIGAVAKLEQTAVESSQLNSQVAAGVLIGLAIAAAAIGWLVGRVTGKLRERMTTPRSVCATPVLYEPETGLRVILNDGPLQVVELTWAPGEYNSDEAEHFVSTYKQIRGIQNRAG